MIRHARLRRVACALALLASATTACASRAAASGVLRAVDIAGAVQVRSSPSQDWVAAEKGRVLTTGWEVRTPADGAARLAGGDASFELGPASWIRVDAPAAVTLKSGRLLVAAKRTSRVQDESGMAIVGPQSVYRLDLGVRTAVYRGEVAVSLPSQEVKLAEYHELSLGLSVADIQGIAPDSSDEWDERYLQDAIELDRSLKPYARSFNANEASAPNSVAFYGRFVDPAALGFLDARLRGPMASYGKLDVLLALYLGLEVAGARSESLGQAVSEVTGFRDARASWGLVAQAFGVKPAVLLDRIVVGLTPGHAPQKVPDRKTPGTRSPDAPTPTPELSRRPSPTPTPSHSASPSPTPTQTHSPSPSPTPSPTASCSVVDQLLGRCTAALL